MLREFKNAFVCFFLLTLITGVIYPLVVTVFAKAVFPDKSEASLLPDGGGSALIGQPFDSPRYFWGRLSGCGYDASSSSGTNFAPTNPALLAAAKTRITALRAADPTNDLPIPVELVTASGSGLDPDIGVGAAEYQADRIAAVRKMDPRVVRKLIADHKQGGVLGPAFVNVLALNRALDGR